MREETDGNGIVTHYNYNELNQLTEVIANYSPGLPAIADRNVSTQLEFKQDLLNGQNQHEELLKESVNTKVPQRLIIFQDGHEDQDGNNCTKATISWM